MGLLIRDECSIFTLTDANEKLAMLSSVAQHDSSEFMEHPLYAQVHNNLHASAR
jgi:hypothetical protein